MGRSAVVFASTTLATGIVAIYLWQQLQAERAHAAQQQELRTQGEPRPLIQLVEAQGAPALPSPTRTPGNRAPEGPPGLGTDLRPTSSSAIEKPVYVLAGSGYVDEGRIAGELGRSKYPDVQKEVGLDPSEADALFLLLFKNAREPDVEQQLGPGKYQLWKDYQSAKDSNRVVNTLRTNLAASSEPLRDEQVRALTDTILTEQRRRTTELRQRIFQTRDPREQLVQDEQTINITEASYRRIVDAARSYLSAPQLFVMQNSMNQLIASQRRSLAERSAGREVPHD